MTTDAREELLAKVEAASGPDRELDRAIWFALFCQPIPPEGIDMEWLSGKPGDRIYPTARRSHYVDRLPTDGTLCPSYTASIDAAWALVDRVLPEALLLVADYKGQANDTFWGGKYQAAKGYASLSLDDEAMSSVRVNAETVPLAIIAALLRAQGGSK